MASKADLYALSQDATFVGRVAHAAEAKAVAIFSEATTGLRSPRKELAIRVLRDPVEEAKGIASVLVTTNVIESKVSPLTNAEVSDADIDTALSDAIWNGYADVFA